MGAKHIWFDGQILMWEEAHISAMTHSLHYGSTVFEGIRVYEGVPFKLREHHERLCNSAKLMGYTIPYSAEQLDKATEQLIEKEQIKYGYIRSFAWRGSETMLIDGEGCKIHTAIGAWDSFNTRNENARNDIRNAGALVGISKWRKPPAQCYPFAAKAAGCYMMPTLIKNEAKANGYDDALVLDSQGFITEGTVANFFIIKGDRLLTPIADCFLNGITRQVVMQIAPTIGLKAEEVRLKVEDLAADAAFFTGTAVGIMPIREIVSQGDNYNYDINNKYLINLSEEYHKLCFSKEG